MTALVDQNLEMYAGDSFELNDTIVTSSGSPKDLTNATVSFIIYNENTNEILITKTNGLGVTITDAVNGLCRINLLPEETEDIKPANWYRYEVDVVDQYANKDTVTVGNFTIHRSNI